MRKYLLILFLSLPVVAVKAQISIPAATLVTEKFNAIGSSATASLPANWKMSSAGTGSIANWSTGTNITATTQAASSGAPVTGGAYNWATTAGTDRSIGFTTDGGYSNPNSIMAFYRNSTGSTVISITVTFAIERFRINTSAFNLSFFSSTDGTTWTARTGGDISPAVFATGASIYTFTSPQTVYKTVMISGLNIVNNGDFYLRWLFNTGNSNSQGIALDDVMLYAGTATPSIVATLRDALTIDNGILNQANPDDQLTYTTVIRNTGTGDATVVNLTDPAPTNTTLIGGSVKTSALARDDSYSTPFNTVLTSNNVLSNDFGLPSPSVVSFGPVKNAVATSAGGTGNSDNGGTVIVNSNGTFTYTPPAGFTGTDKFAYIATTGTAPDNDAVVTISVGATVNAVNDNYNVIGNVSISPNMAAGLISNDAGNGPVMVAVNGSAANVGTAITTGQGGNLTVNADGSFTYNPPKGFEGADNFTYTLDNGYSLPSTATVTLTVSGMIWFVNNAGGAGDGRLSSPFNSIAALQAANTGGAGNPDINDYIFIYESVTDYTGTLNLLNGQKLIGQDATASLASITGYTVTAYSTALPVMNSGNGTIVNLTTSLASTNGINLNVVAGSNLLRGFNIGNTTGAAISGSGFGTLTASDISITGSGQCLVLSTGTINAVFNNISSNSSAGAVFLSGLAGTVTVNSGTITGSTGASIAISGGTLSVNYSGNITQANNAAMVSVSGGHATGTITFQTGTLSATNGTGLQFDNADGIYNFNGTATMNGGDAGIDIINGSGGSYSFNTTTSITNPSGTGFFLSASNCSGTFSGSVTDNTGFVIDINNYNSGTFTFQTGSINSTAQGIRVINCAGGTINFDSPTKSLNTGTNKAVTLNNNGPSTINFRNGGLVIVTTAATGFDATGGATAINITGSGNTITTTTGSAVNFDNTTIGASGLNFLSISVNGAVNGLLLNNTGSLGGLSVTGNGTPGSGGTIQNCVQHGARFANCVGIGLSWINLNNNGTSNLDPAAVAGDCLNGANVNAASGIDLQTVNGVTLNNLTISGGVQIGLNGKGVSNLVMNNSSIQNAGNEVLEDGFQISNLSGICSISNCSFTGNFHRQFEVQNSTGSLTLTITGSTFDRLTYVSTSAQGVLIAGRLTAAITASIKSSLFQNNFGSAVFGQSIDNANVNMTIGSVGTSNIPAEGNTFTNNSLGFQIVADNASTMSFNIGNNTYTVTATVTSGATPFSVRKGTNATGSVTGTIGYNTIGSSTSQSGNNCSGCNGLSITDEGISGGMNVTVRNNLIQHVNQRGVEAIMQLNDLMSVVVINNTIQSPDATIGQAIFGQSGNDATDNGTLCMEIQGNIIGGNWDTGVGVTRNIRLRQAPAGGAAVLRLRNLAGSTTTDVVNYLNANNTNAQASATATGSFTGGTAACN